MLRDMRDVFSAFMPRLISYFACFISCAYSSRPPRERRRFAQQNRARERREHIDIAAADVFRRRSVLSAQRT